MPDQKTVRFHWLPISLGVIIVVLIGSLWYITRSKPVIAPTPTPDLPIGSQPLVPGEPLAAELVGLHFLDRSFSYLESPSPELEAEIITLLAPDIRAQFAESSQSFQDVLLDFLYLESLPDQGFSEEDLQFAQTSASLIIGLNYSESPRLIRQLELVHTSDGWLITAALPLATYPPETQIQ